MAEAAGFHFERIGPDTDQRAALILLHGSGSSEHALMDFALRIAPDRPAFAVRGRTPWDGGHAFFRRNPDRTLDHEDLAARCLEFCGFLGHLTAMGHRRPLLVGYSNGAIMAAAAVAQAPEFSSGAVLLRPLSPWPDRRLAPLPGYPILLLGGAADTRRAPSDTPYLADQFRQADAAVEAHVLPTGHGWDEDGLDERLVRDWLKDRA